MMRNSRGTIFWVVVIIAVVVVAVGVLISKVFLPMGLNYSFKDSGLIDLGGYDKVVTKKENVILKSEADYQKLFGAPSEDEVDFDQHNYAVGYVEVDGCRRMNLQPTDHGVDGNKVWMTVEYEAGCEECKNQKQYEYYLVPIDKSITEARVEVDTRAVNQPNCNKK